MILPHQLERALVQLLKTAGLDAALATANGLADNNDAGSYIVPGTEAGTLPDNGQPCIICRVSSGPEMPPYSGNYQMPCVIEVVQRAAADDQQTGPTEAFTDLCDAVQCALPVESEAFCDAVNTAARLAGLTCTAMGLLDVQSPDTVPGERGWTCSFAFTLYACAADVLDPVA